MCRRKQLPTLILIIFLFLWARVVVAQVANNNIENRSLLIEGANSIRSDTKNSSVEWQCINKSLTNKCLVYHNDQWFYFMPSVAGKYYLNIYSQTCRDNRGIQVILIEGNPCEANTYRILQCIDKVPQDDVFITMDSLKENTQYLVNIDGFLNDFCDFNIQLSTRPNGFPFSMKQEEEIPMQVHLRDSVVTLAIHAGNEQLDQIENLEVYRSYAKDSHSPTSRSTYMKSISVERNSVGSLVTDYTFYDTLSERGQYRYIIMAQGHDGDRILVLDIPVRYFGSLIPTAQPETQKNVDINIHIESQKKHLALDVYCYDGITNNLLLYKMIAFEKDSKKIISLHVDDYILKGIRNFVIKTVDQKSGEVKQYTYFINEEGNLVNRK